ncbi:MAG: CHAT domain-containing protein [Crocosphaera sp.]|nr:CHAT domain-containing protein [Crocosphaera sp.]
MRWPSLINFFLLFLISIAVPLWVSQVSLSTPIIQTQHNVLELIEQAKQQYQEKKFSEAAIIWQQMADTFGTKGDTLNQAMALSNLSLTYQQLGQWNEAKTTINQSISLLESIENSPVQARILAASLDIKGQLQLSLGEAVNALNNWQEATKIYKNIGNHKKVFQSKINQAQAMQQLGFYPRACQTLIETLDIKTNNCEISENNLENLPEKISISQKVLGLRSLANVLRVTGKTKQSQLVLLKSFQLAQTEDNLEALAAIYLSLGNTARVLGYQIIAREKQRQPINSRDSITCIPSQNYQKSEEFYQQAIACYHKAASGTLSITKIQAQLNSLSLFIQREKWNQVLKIVEKLQTELIDNVDNQIILLPPSREIVTAQLKLAQNFICLQTIFNSNNPQLVTPILQSCPTVKKTLNVNEIQSLSIPTWTTINKLIETALNQAQTIGDKQGEANAFGYLGATYQGLGNLTKAKQLTESSLQRLSAFDNPELAYLWQWQLGRFYQLESKNQKAIASYTLAVEILESLRQDLVVTNADIQYNFRDSVEPVYRELVAQLLQPSNTGKISQENLTKARKIIESLQLAELNNFFQEACIDAQPQQIDELDPNAAVIYSIVLPQHLAVILSIPGNPLSYYQTSFKNASLEVEAVFDDLFAQLNPYISSPEPLNPHQKLYDWLIRPLETELKENQIKTLVFVHDGILRGVPMAALHDGQQYLIEKYHLALTPGLQLLSPKSLSSDQLTTLAGGLAEARQGFSALPGVKEEVKEISEIVSAEVLLDQQFTSDRLQQAIESTSFPIVHLATHGQFSSQVEDTFLLTWDERINVKNLDQFLREREGQQRSPIELLILSACQTATGDKRAVLGLAGVAVRSGARSTLATLWSVQDDSTADLIAQFYKILSQSGISKAEALRQAQLSLLRSPQYQHPFYWAPFVLVGNWL